MHSIMGEYLDMHEQLWLADHTRKFINITLVRRKRWTEFRIQSPSFSKLIPPFLSLEPLFEFQLTLQVKELFMWIE
jgi:hypothetical protein